LSELLRQIKELIEYIENLEETLDRAKAHIKANIMAFTPQELECMALDGIISFHEIPKDKRTDYVKNRLKEA
jgi:hypothetical protein